jgi:TonB family protein
LSLNLAANKLDNNSLQAADFIFAGVVHLIVIVLIVIVSWWQSVSAPDPLPRIEVEMISGKELKNLQIAEKMRSIQKKRAAMPKPKPAVKPKQKQQAIAKDDFDPFAPVESESNVTKPTAGRNDMADMIGKQLSTQEIGRYIAMMKQAIEKRWKVASDPGKVSNPLVEVVLNPNGRVASARIIDSSGNPTLDQTLLAAIYAAEPFQVPPRSQFEPFRVNNISFEPLK